MLEKLYNKYFQKSKSFLYPLLGIKKNSPFNPAGTYLCIDGMIPVDDIKLICSFEENSSEEFQKFENNMLTTNPLYHSKIKIPGYNLYVFDLDVYQNDWMNFMLGKYSKLSNVVKRAIKTYFGENSAEYKYIETYLFPEKYFEQYAQLLQVDLITLKKIGELCNPCDLEKETLKIPSENFEVVEKKL
jgi:hypothetical protein